MTQPATFYEIIGVPPSADYPDIKKAYYKQALENHPDRGGSHEKMVQLNEAWGVLSDPISRKEYDAYLANPSDEHAQHSAEANSSAARRKAADYPRDWSEFNSRFNSIADDFTKAQYGTSKVAFGVEVPTVANSCSGVAFLIVGGIIGVVILWQILWQFNIGNNLSFASAFRNWRIFLMVVVAPAVGGAHVGALLHKFLGTMLASGSPAASDPPCTEAPSPTLQRFWSLFFKGQFLPRLRRRHHRPSRSRPG